MFLYNGAFVLSTTVPPHTASSAHYPPTTRSFMMTSPGRVSRSGLSVTQPDREQTRLNGIAGNDLSSTRNIMASTDNA